MGNCQATADAAGVLIQHPSGRIERKPFQVTAGDVMVANPGHYVAAIYVASSKDGDGGVQTHLRLLRPQDLLNVGSSYRLISFEEVLREFSGKKYVNLSKVIAMQKSRAAQLDSRMEMEKQQSRAIKALGMEEESMRGLRRQSQWRPTLHSISEN
eukprot:TRINITY_DN5506_c0_g1_i2.p1 TRINITY_DN5506_c0_g1~~TRINITY_DN5506_c0_g1_i2.p1  ORF type:complete len:155 (+),score=20.84 TRINITY_DN5506_c0_g1_i2:233-697(+)